MATGKVKEKESRKYEEFYSAIEQAIRKYDSEESRIKRYREELHDPKSDRVKVPERILYFLEEARARYDPESARGEIEKIVEKKREIFREEIPKEAIREYLSNKFLKPAQKKRNPIGIKPLNPENEKELDARCFLYYTPRKSHLSPGAIHSRIKKQKRSSS